MDEIKKLDFIISLNNNKCQLESLRKNVLVLSTLNGGIFTPYFHHNILKYLPKIDKIIRAYLVRKINKQLKELDKNIIKLLKC